MLVGPVTLEGLERFLQIFPRVSQERQSPRSTIVNLLSVE